MKVSEADAAFLCVYTMNTALTPQLLVIILQCVINFLFLENFVQTLKCQHLLFSMTESIEL